MCGLCLKRFDDCLEFGFAVLVKESLNEMGNYAYNRAQTERIVTCKYQLL